MKVIQARMLSLVILIVLIVPTVIASDLDITLDQLTISGKIGERIDSSFEIRNIGNTILTDINTSISNALSSGSDTISNSNIQINLSSNLTINPGDSKVIEFSVNLPNSIAEGNYIGAITSTNGNYSDVLILIVQAQKQDLTAPTVLTHTPLGRVATSSLTLSVTTNENAICKYSTSAGIEYDYMDGIFSSTGGTIHNQELKNLVDGEYHYYVKCKDNEGNKAQNDYDATFTLDTSPKASIVLSDASPLKAGTVEVTLTTSETTRSTPSLAYSFDGSSHIYIPLTGSGNTWKGYMIIPEGIGHKVGSFRFSATDLSGNTGNTITEGGIFIVDTTKPSQILSIESTSEEGGNIKVVWYFEEEVEKFNIYRSKVKGTDYTDFYESTESKVFKDYNVESGETYYYKVSAVDKAGNEGPLSREVSATARIGGEISTSNQKTKETKLAPELIGNVDKLIKKVEKIEEDINTIRSEFKISKDKELIEKVSLEKEIQAGESELKKIKNELENLKSQDLTQIELEKKLKRIELNIKIAKKLIPESLIILESDNYMQNLNENLLDELIQEIHPELLDDQKENYFQENKIYLKDIKVRIIAKVLNIGYLDGTEKEITLIQKEIEIKNFPQDGSLVEIIPKTIEEDIKNIKFNNKEYQVLKEDPIIQWRKVNEISYVINKKIDTDEIKNTYIFILTKSPKTNLGNTQEDIITGLTTFVSFKNIFNSKIDSGILFGIVIILGLGIYYIFFIKNYRPKIKFKRKTLKKATEQDINQIKNIINLLNKAQQHINLGMLNMASDTYNIILNEYKKIENESQEKNQLHKKIINLCNRIDSHYLKNLILEAKNLLSLQKKEEAKSVYNDIKLVYKKLPKNFKKNFSSEFDDIGRRLGI